MIYGPKIPRRYKKNKKSEKVEAKEGQDRSVNAESLLKSYLSTLKTVNSEDDIQDKTGRGK